MSTTPIADSESFHMEDSDDVYALARTLVDGHHPGILCTVDEHGNPKVRWMATLAFDEFPVFHTLTNPDSRKVQEIRHHPGVAWMFFNEDRSLILNLSGKATVHTDTTAIKRIWRKIQDKSHAYFLNRFAPGVGCAVIETTVESIECSSPQNFLRFTIQPDELARSHH